MGSPVETPDTVDRVASGTETPPRESFRSVLTWPAVTAATVLAALAAGAVLWFATNQDNSNSAGYNLHLTDGDDEVESVRLTDPVEVGHPLEVELAVPGQESSTNLRDLLDGRPMLVNLFGSWCTPCIKEMPDLQQVYEELDGAVDFVGVALHDRPEDTASIVETTGVTYPWFGDRDGHLLIAVEGTTMPTTFLLGADGTVARVKAGALDIDAIRDLIEESFPGVT